MKKFHSVDKGKTDKFATKAAAEIRRLSEANELEKKLKEKNRFKAKHKPLRTAAAPGKGSQHPPLPPTPLPPRSPRNQNATVSAKPSTS